MHPEIVRDAPGSCPICGMAFEPMVPVVEVLSPMIAAAAISLSSVSVIMNALRLRNVKV